MDERARVLPRLCHRSGFHAPDGYDFLDLMCVMSTLVDLNADHLSRAHGSGLGVPDDAPMPATHPVPGADGLVTGDVDTMEWAEASAIVSPADFCTRQNPWAAHDHPSQNHPHPAQL